MARFKIKAIMTLLMTIKIWFLNNFKHVEISVGKNCKIKNLKLASCGIGNVVNLGDNVILKNVSIKIFGNNNFIEIKNCNNLSEVRFVMEDNENRIEIGENTYIGEGTLLAALEGKKINIGSDCMIAGPCEIRISDSHSLLNGEGRRVNFGKDVIINDHCWIGTQCLILKGVNIPSNSVVAARSLVLEMKAKVKNGTLIGGTPAKILKEEINWYKERI